MKTFHCTHCQALVFFENVQCLACGHTLAFLPDHRQMAALTQGEDGAWRPEGMQTTDAYHLCSNYTVEHVCNWAVRADDEHALCESCRFTRVIPNLAPLENREHWYRLEAAKRRLFYTLKGLKLPLQIKQEPQDAGLTFEFLQDTPDGGDESRVLTGHDNGLITLNVAEADDVLRERERVQQHEPYRTLVGHFRHEIGHYYWDRLIASSPRLEAFRAVFGDEQLDYSEALQRHYANGPPPQWEASYISGYATMHPWEDWAETWAHYLHMVDALETAGSTGLAIKPRRADEPQMPTPKNPLRLERPDFDQMIGSWIPLTYVLNNLSRSLGLADSYPFVITPTVIQKLRFVHDTIFDSARGT